MGEKFQNLESGFKEAQENYYLKVEKLLHEGLSIIFSEFPQLASFQFTYYGKTPKNNEIAMELPKVTSDCRPLSAVLGDVRKYADRPNIVEFLKEELEEAQKIYDNEEIIKKEIISLIALCPEFYLHKKFGIKSKIKFSPKEIENLSEVKKPTFADQTNPDEG